MARIACREVAAEGDVQEFMHAQGWAADGFPVVAPTRAKVQAMLRATPYDPQKVLGKCPPNYAEVTVTKVAVNAVLAGCLPKHFPVVLAAVEASLDPQFGAHGLCATTMGATPAIVVNGPVRDQCGINYQHGVLGSGHRANACIGRALKLVLSNVGGVKLGGTESTTIGTPMKYTMCAGEWEEFATAWEPYHVTRGFDRDESVVTVMGVTSGPYSVVSLFAQTADELCDSMAKSLVTSYASWMPMINQCLIVISPEHYQTLLSGGITSKDKFKKLLWQKCNKHMAPEIRTIVQNKMQQNGGFLGGLVGAGIGMALGMAARGLNLVTGAGLPLLPKFDSPDSFQVIVAGAPAGKFTAFAPGFGLGRPPMPSANMCLAVSRKVLPLAAASEDDAEPSESKGDVLLDPTAEDTVAEKEMAPRTGSIQGTIGLLDISKGGGAKFFDELQRLLKREFPGVNILRYCKATFSRPADDGLRETIAKACRHVVVALAD